MLGVIRHALNCQNIFLNDMSLDTGFTSVNHFLRSYLNIFFITRNYIVSSEVIYSILIYLVHFNGGVECRGKIISLGACKTWLKVTSAKKG